ncbi:MAG: hypothetical protein ACTHOG_13580 [Marmoricola sp.]
MSALLQEFDVTPFDEVALSEIALRDLLDRCDRLHRSNIQHEPASCLVCFEHR